MLEKYYPCLYAEGIEYIDMKLLAEKGIKGLILDIDNTLVPNHVKDADERAVNWVEKAKKEGFKLCIVSNASKKRVVRFNEKLKIYAIHRALKPAKRALLKAAKLMEIQPSEAAMIGDQIFTDVRGGNKLGMFTVLVKTIDEKEQFFVRLKRMPEKFILSKYMSSISNNNTK